MSSPAAADGLIYSQMRAMVSLMDRLRDFKLDELISLPKIAVLGMQSAGKSSLLESVCGLNFLPRGSGIVTRRPLELRMVHKPVPEPYFVFPGEFNEKVFKNPDDVRKAIEDLTDKVAGAEKGVSPIPIILNVFGPNVPDLTVIDLPGITKIAVDRQERDIEKVTKDLVRKYCGDPGVVILCVIPANIDLATSESLKFAMEIDPQGERTLGVLTKVDLMDQGTSAGNVLLNKEIPLKYGYVAVKGRSQKETMEKVPVDQSLRAEVEFFAKHPSYSGLPGDLLGTRALVDRMSKILYKLISKSLPRIRDEMISKKAAVKQTLEVLGSDFPDTDQAKMERIFELVQAFHDYFCQEITGKLFDPAKVRRLGSGKPPKASETITYLFNQYANDLLAEYFENGYRISDEFSDEYINHAITTYQGENLPGFYSFDSFIFLINPKLQLLHTPTTTLLDEIKTIVEERALEIIDFFLGKHPALAGTCKEIFSKVAAQRKKETHKVLERLTKCHENYFFTNDPAIMDMTVTLTTKGKAPRHLTSGQLIILEMRARLDNYFRIVVRNLRDTVPKVIGSFFLKRMVESAKTDILQELNQKGYCLDAFKEAKGVGEQRARAKDELKALAKAEDVLAGEFGMVFSQSTQSSEKTAMDTSVSTGMDELSIDDLANLESEFLRVSFNQMASQRRAKGQPAGIGPGMGPSNDRQQFTRLPALEKGGSHLNSENPSLNDSGLKKRYTLTGESDHTRYVLREEGGASPYGLPDSTSQTSRTAPSTHTPSSLSSQPRPPIPPSNTNPYDLDLTGGASKKNVAGQMATAKGAYETYDLVNKNFTKDEQKEILSAGAQAVQYGQQNMTKEQAKTAYDYTVAGGKYVTENFTKEQIVSGAKTVYEGGKYAANSAAGQKIIGSMKDLAAKGVDASKNQAPAKPKNNLFGDFF